MSEILESLIDDIFENLFEGIELKDPELIKWERDYIRKALCGKGDDMAFKLEYMRLKHLDNKAALKKYIAKLAKLIDLAKMRFLLKDLSP